MGISRFNSAESVTTFVMPGLVGRRRWREESVFVFNKWVKEAGGC